jgi:hypothetical protein
VQHDQPDGAGKKSPNTAGGNSSTPFKRRLLDRRWVSSLGSTLLLLALAVAGGWVLYLHITPAFTSRVIPVSRSPSPAVTTSPSGVNSLAVSPAVSIKCTLPVTVYSRRVRIKLAKGAVTVDGAQSFDRSGRNANAYLDGRWLPVPTSWIAPDGGSYASMVGVPDSAAKQAVLITEIASGKQREVWRGAGGAEILGWGSGGVYLMLQPSSPQNQAGSNIVDLWVLDPGRPGQARLLQPTWVSPESGSAGRPVFSSEARLARNAAWDTTRSAASGRVQVEQMDLGTTSVSVWYTAPAETAVFIVGFDDAGYPVLALYGSDTSSTKALLLLTGPNQPVVIWNASDVSARFATAFGDPHGIWIGSAGSLWLYRSGSLLKVTDVPVETVGAQAPMPISNAPGGTGNLSPPTVVGRCS